MRPVVTRDFAVERLALIFPRAAFDTVMSNPLAGHAVAAMIYVDAIATNRPETTVWSRPSTVTWLSDEVLTRTSEADRAAWRLAAKKTLKAVADLLTSWGLPSDTGYAGGSRETVRDETYRKWREAGALRKRTGKAPSYPGPIWALESDFADLFDPGLTGAALTTAIETWRETHLSPGAKLKAAFAVYEEQSSTAVKVTMPGGNGDTRTLEPGIASLILKGVIEQWAPARLGRPVVVTISEPGDKLFTGDNDLLKYLGISIQPSKLLPDAVLADLDQDPVRFWIVEAVNTDGPIDENRKAQLLTWAQQQKIAPADCRFLTAFRSRNDPAARKRLKDLASDTYAWYADEPTHELSWHELATEAD